MNSTEYQRMRISPRELAQEPALMSVYMKELRFNRQMVTDLAETSGEGLTHPLSPEVAQSFRNFQTLAVCRMNDIYQHSIGAPACFSEFYNNAINEMLEVLISLDQFLAAYLHSDMVLPVVFARHLEEKLQPRLLSLKNFMQHNKLPPALTDIIFTHLHIHKNTFGAVHYCREVMEALQRQHLQQYISFEERILFTLYQFNFNDPALFHYVIKQLRSKIPGLPSLQQKKALLSWYEKELQHLEPAAISLFPETTSIKNKLIIWLREEKLFLHNLFSTCLS